MARSSAGDEWVPTGTPMLPYVPVSETERSNIGWCCSGSATGTCALGAVPAGSALLVLSAWEAITDSHMGSCSEELVPVLG